MRKRLIKQAGFCLLIALALFVSKNSNIDILEKGADTVISQMEVNYTKDDAVNTLKKGAVAVSAVPDKFESAVSTVTGKPMYGEPIDDSYSGSRASVFAVENGEITAVGENETIGKYIRITHGKDGESLYGNLDKTFVEVPEKVKRGQIIGTYKKSEDKEFYYSFKEFN
ncbi:MAG: peptidoglycan DD-metalloendopeptidase family protein [Anaerovoracaceae bacterium]